MLMYSALSILITLNKSQYNQLSSADKKAKKKRRFHSLCFDFCCENWIFFSHFDVSDDQATFYTKEEPARKTKS